MAIKFKACGLGELRSADGAYFFALSASEHRLVLSTGIAVCRRRPTWIFLPVVIAHSFGVLRANKTYEVVFLGNSC